MGMYKISCVLSCKIMKKYSHLSLSYLWLYNIKSYKYSKPVHFAKNPDTE